MSVAPCSMSYPLLCGGPSIPSSLTQQTPTAALVLQLSLTDLNPFPHLQVSYLPRMCLPYPSLSPAQPSSDEEEGERQSPPLEVSDGEADGLEPGPGLLHGETGRAQPQSQPLTQPGSALGPDLTLAAFVPLPYSSQG
jgi:hypothetical protein